ncbi:response regulator [candidate division KSB1 bacterium]|nr:response regulator [candidate division KSB1 bacterium]
MNIKGKILVIDDEDSILRILDRFLTDMGFQVFTANSWDKALQTFFQDKFELIILDIFMPGRDGFELAQEMRLTRPNQKILIITGLDAADVYKHLTTNEAEFSDILYKPFSFAKIKTVISSVLSSN